MALRQSPLNNPAPIVFISDAYYSHYTTVITATTCKRPQGWPWMALCYRSEPVESMVVAGLGELRQLDLHQ